MNGDIAPKTLYLIRHGAAEGVAGRCIGQTDVTLSDEGRTQCLTLAQAWRPPDGSVLWCSDLLRAQESAQVMAESWVMASAPSCIEPDLRECAFGEWEGRTWVDIESADGARLDAWMRDWTTMAPPGGESLPRFAARVGRVLAHIARSAGGHHVIVSHAGVLRAMLCLVIGAPQSAAFAWAMPHAHVSAVTVIPSSAGSDAVRGSVEWLHAFPSPGGR